MIKALVTGGLGFIGSNLIRKLLNESLYYVVNVDNESYAGKGSNLHGPWSQVHKHGGYKLIKADVADEESINKIFHDERPDIIFHLAAESHVDRSILSSKQFVRTNVEGTRVLLEAAKTTNVKRFIYVSTDEVYGDLGPTGAFTEESPYMPNNPYSASKASGDMLARAFWKTHKLPIITTHCSNNYGPFQYPEKLIPLMVINAINMKPLPVYGDGKNVRDWIHVDDHCNGLIAAATHGISGEAYNFGGDECDNITLVERILSILDKPFSLIKYVTDRIGHDKRYAIDTSKSQKLLKWHKIVDLTDGITATVQWYKNNEAWWCRLVR